MENKSVDNKKIITSLAIVIIVVLSGFFLLKDSTPLQKTSEVSEIGGDLGIMPITAEDHIMGNKNARIIIVEYSDTGCPFCKRFHADMHKLIATNKEVAWVYRHYPILSLHPEAFKEAVASECAAKYGGNEIFWKYIDEIYAQTDVKNLSLDQKLINIASGLDLNLSDFKTCLETMQTALIVESHMADGNENGVRGTPTSFVIKDGKLAQTIPGALPYTELNAFITSLLK